MKNFFKHTCLLLLITATVLKAQPKPGNYTPSGGFLVGGTYSWIQLKDYPDYSGSKGRPSFTGGAFVNYPFTTRLFLQPQLMYSIMGGTITNDLNSDFDRRQLLYYASLPVLLKYDINEKFAVFAGPQLDYLLTARQKIGNEIEGDNSGDLNNIDYAATAGVEIFPRNEISLQARYMHGFNKLDKNLTGSQGNYNQGVQLTISVRIFGKGEKYIPPPPPPPADSDSDGVIDPSDKCPYVAGVVAYEGCPIPDSDSDGVLDPDDECPSVAGLEKYKGCPIPDSDGDSFNDEQDQCPTVPGVAAYNGCPIPDSDTDGILDPDDACPTIAGVVENGGCPAVEKFSASNIQFVSGSAQLTSKAIGSLVPLIDYLNKYPDLKMEINGHTDDAGKDEANQKLSEDRAAAVKNQLIKKGIDAARLTSQGFGETQPVADNTTPAGRAANRRVELKFRQ
ncbi:MAG: OmpA family protein [Chitinophagaceae bacterium]|nr:OmpA family protein [Chitinophagaceae bacterium]